MARGTAEKLDMVDLKPRFKASPVVAKTVKNLQYLRPTSDDPILELAKVNHVRPPLGG